jgi:hypothetical protein
MREGVSATSDAYIRWFYRRKIRKNGAKTVKKPIYNYAAGITLAMVALSSRD